MTDEVFADWCKEDTATTGTGTITLAGGYSAFTEFADVYADAAIVPYCIIDGNPNEEDRKGRFVSLYKGKIVQGAGRSDKSGIANYLASLFTNPSSSTNVEMIGVVSTTPSVVGDSAPNHWKGRSVRDKYGRKEFNSYTKHTWREGEEEVCVYVEDLPPFRTYSEYPQYTHKGILSTLVPPGDAVTEQVTFPKVNPTYDHNIPYIPRSERPEWSPIGLIGKVVVDSAEPITADFVDPTGDGRCVNGARYEVLEVIDNYTVRIFLK